MDKQAEEAWIDAFGLTPEETKQRRFMVTKYPFRLGYEAGQRNAKIEITDEITLSVMRQWFMSETPPGIKTRLFSAMKDALIAAFQKETK